jgi:hypothetical protein
MSLPSLRHANAHFVTPQLLVGGDLSFDERTAAAQLEELVGAGVTHIVDVRVEANDAPLVAELARAAGDEVELVELPDADHFDVVDTGHEAWAAVVERLPRLLGA